jgi:hypothetical protein
MPSPVEILGLVLIAVALFMLVARGVLHESNFQTPIITLKAPTSVLVLLLGVALFLFPQWWPVVSAARQAPGASPGPSAEAPGPSSAPPQSAGTPPSAGASTEPTSPPPSSPPPSAIAPSTFKAESVVEVVDPVRLRPTAGTKKRQIADLPVGARMLVVSGPIGREGLDWYEVLTFPLSGGVPPHGWVAAAAADGVPWIGPVNPACPSAPTTVTQLTALDSSTALACLGRLPLTVRVRLLRCETPLVETLQSHPCKESPGAIEPQWLDPDADVQPGTAGVDRFVMVNLAGDLRGDSPVVRLTLARGVDAPASLSRDIRGHRAEGLDALASLVASSPNR